MVAVGGCVEGGDKERINGTGVGGAVQINRAVIFVIWVKEFGGYMGRAKSTRGIPLSFIQTYFGDDCAAYNERRVGVARGGWRTRD